MLTNRSARTEIVSADQVQDEISHLLRQLADPVVAGESTKACMRRVSMRTGLPYGQIKRAWYKEWRQIPAHIADTIRLRAATHNDHLRRAMLQAVQQLSDSNPEFYRDALSKARATLAGESDAAGREGNPD